MNHQRIRIAVLCTIAACAGCDRAWNAYEQIEVGQPLSADSLLLAEGGPAEHIHAWGESDYVVIPAIMGGLGVSAMVDAQGNVTGKGYVAEAYGHWGLCQSVAIRRVIEIEVPEYAYHDPPAEGLTDGWDIGWSTYVTSEGYVELTEGDDHDLGLWKGEDPTNVLEYLIFARPKLSLVGARDAEEEGQGVWPAGMFFGLYMFCGGQDRTFSELHQYGAALTGMTQEGFDWTYRNPYGYTLRIQHLGDRRFRVEENYFRVIDPFFIIPYIDMAIMSLDK